MVTRKIVAFAALLFVGAAIGSAASAQQQADCAARAQRLQARAEAFDARCSSHPMTIGGPEWQACQAEHDAIMEERARWLADCGPR